jgi:hypothetical protein
LQNIANLYVEAAKHASEVRSCAIQWLADDSPIQDDIIKEWIECLLLNHVVGVELEGDEEEEELEDDEENDDKEKDNDGTEDKAEESEAAKKSGGVITKKDGTDQEDAKDTEELESWSSSAVESTARFMAATLFSMLNEHDLAKEQLKGFDLSHRIHPNVWKGETKNSTAKLSPVDPDNLEPALFPKNVLPNDLFQRLCQVFAPDSAYWGESGYDQRGYYSYFSDLPSPVDASPSNLIEEVVCSQLLPLVKQRLSKEQADSIVGYEWWVHTRPVQANLGHNLHFDTDEAMLSQSQEITHPLFSSVLYLSGGTTSGPTFVIDQTPNAETLPEKCWFQKASNNSLLVFPGNLLHGVLPCPGDLNASSCSSAPLTYQNKLLDISSWLDKPLSFHPPEEHRLTFMVGFWTRRVPDTMQNRSLYGPCGPLPPNTPEHSWATMISEGYNGEKRGAAAVNEIQPIPVTQVSPVWEVLDIEPSDPPLVLPRAIDHRFFVKNAPKCFHDSLFERDEFDEEEDDYEYHSHDHHHDHDHEGACCC